MAIYAIPDAGSATPELAIRLTIERGHSVHCLEAAEPTGDHPFELQPHLYRVLRQVSSGRGSNPEILAARLDQSANGAYIVADIYVLRLGPDGINLAERLSDVAGQHLIVFIGTGPRFSLYDLIRYAKGFITLGHDLEEAVRRAVDNAETAQLVDLLTVRAEIRQLLYDPSLDEHLGGDFRRRLAALSDDPGPEAQSERRALVQDFITAFIITANEPNDDDDEDEDEDLDP